MNTKTEKQNITIQILAPHLPELNDRADSVNAAMKAAGYIPQHRCVEYNSAIFKYSARIYFAARTVNA
jgi:hypothetical protein